MSDIRRKTIGGLRVGDSFAVSRTFTAAEVARFTEISRDHNPIHHDMRFVKIKKMDGCICHGLLVASLLTEIGGQMGWLASGMELHFKKPVYFGDTITCTLTLTHMGDKGRAKARAVFSNQDNVCVLDAVLTGKLPGPEEKKVLKALLVEEDPAN